MSNVTRWLVFAEVGVAFRGLEAPRSAAVSAIRLPASCEPVGTAEWLTYDEVVADRYLHWNQAGQSPDRDQTFPAPRAVFTGFGVRASRRPRSGRLPPSSRSTPLPTPSDLAGD